MCCDNSKTEKQMKSQFRVIHYRNISNENNINGNTIKIKNVY